MSSSGGVTVPPRPVRDENRFYHPPPIRRLKQERERQQQEEEKKQQQSQQENENRKQSQQIHARNGLTCSTEDKNKKKKMQKKKNTRVNGSEEFKSLDCSVSGRPATEASNLDRFLECTTPVVPAHYLARARGKDWRTSKPESHPYYVLGDLWDSLMEWSAYGVGVPLILKGSNSVVQYYVPYLSGIQLYIDSFRHGPNPRRLGEDSDVDSLRETTSSEDSCDYGPNIHQNAANMNTQNFSRLSLNDKSFVGSSSDESEICNPPGQLVFEYFEHEPPFGREPLADKISNLAARFPELKTYKSCNLSPSSWFSVAWYPIYRIPVGPTLQNLDACFLTFHSLSTSIQGPSRDNFHFHISHGMESCRSGTSLKLRLPTFGLASYKFKVPVWDPSGSSDCPRATLVQAAEKWLRQLQVNHPDYRFFVTHSPQ